MIDVDNLRRVRANAIRPALALLPPGMTSDRAEVMLIAIGLQESRLTARRQDGGGPARGLWQFERGGGVLGVLKHEASRAHAARICALRGVAPESPQAWAALERDDVLAAVFARLLLWTDPGSLPPTGQPGAAWDLYLRTWRPGQPHLHTWAGFHATAVVEVIG